MLWHAWTVRRLVLSRRIVVAVAARAMECLSFHCRLWQLYAQRRRLTREFRHLARTHYGVRLCKRVVDVWLHFASQASKVSGAAEDVYPLPLSFAPTVHGCVAPRDPWPVKVS